MLQPVNSVILRHELIAQHRVGEILLAEMCRVSPRFQRHLLPHRVCETLLPPVAGELLVHVVPRGLVHKPGLLADVVVDGCQLDELPQQRDSPYRPEVLVPYHGLGYGFGLLGGAAELRTDEVVGDEAAVEFKGEARCAEVGVCCADVVQEASQGEGGSGESACVGWELLLEDGTCFGGRVSEMGLLLTWG